MPTYYARKTGNVNATDVWATTPTGTAAAVTFAAGDVLVANSFAVALNVDTNLGGSGQIRNDAFSGATAGGSFLIANGVTLTANVIGGTGASFTLSNNTASASASIVGSITAGSASGAHGVTWNSTGTLTVTGNVASGVSTSNGINISSGSLVITGNVTGASGHAIRCPGASVVAITITGTVTGGTAAATASGVSTAGNNTPITIVGTAVGGQTVPGVDFAALGGALLVTRAKGGPAASGGVGVSCGSTSIASVESIEFGDAGASPTSGPIRLVDNASNVAVMYRFGTTKKTLTDPNASGLMPAASDVRSGVVYNGGNSTGTCAVPAASSVVSGALVDATAGTAALTPASLWDYLTSAATTSGSMGERLSNCATVASVGQSLANALTP